MSRLFCLMGKSACGKDSIYQELAGDPSLLLQRVVPYTTRPRRSTEEEGREYHFVKQETFLEMKEAGRVIESRTYQTVHGPWTYFTADDGSIRREEEHSYLLVVTLEAYLALRAYYGEEHVIPLYLEVEDGERLCRALARERRQDRPDYEEMCRRFLADQKDFSEEKLEEAGIRRRYLNVDKDACIRQIRDAIGEICAGGHEADRL